MGYFPNFVPSCAVKCDGYDVNVSTSDNEKIPTVIVIPGLTSDSTAAVSYISYSQRVYCQIYLFILIA